MSSFAQDTTKVLLKFGVGYGKILGNSDLNSPYNVDGWSYARKHGLNIQLGVGYKFNSNLSLFLNSNFESYFLNKEKLIQSYSNEFPDFHYYNDQELDLTNSTDESFSKKLFSCILERKVEFKKFFIVPLAGIGFGHFRHREYTFALRPKNNNQHIEYNIKGQFKFKPALHIGTKFNLKKIPDAYIEIQYTYQKHIGNYEISNDNLTYNTSYNKPIHLLNLGVIYQGLIIK